MHGCLRNNSCMSSSFPPAILNGYFIFSDSATTRAPKRIRCEMVIPTNSYVQKNFRGVKKFHLLFGAVRLLEYILLIMEQMAWVSRWFVLKKRYCQNVLLRSLTESNTLQCLLFRTRCRCKARVGTTSDLICVDTIQSMNGIVCWYNLLCFEKNMTKKINLMILDNSGIDYSRMLLFVLGFLVYWKIEPNSHASGNTWFTTWFQSGHI